MSTVLDEIAARRLHQILKGYDADHDDTHTAGEIAVAAALYAMGALRRRIPISRTKGSLYDILWPFKEPLKAKSQREELIDAAAMIVAEIERIDRIKAKGGHLAVEHRRRS